MNLATAAQRDSLLWMTSALGSKGARSSATAQALVVAQGEGAVGGEAIFGEVEEGGAGGGAALVVTDRAAVVDATRLDDFLVETECGKWHTDVTLPSCETRHCVGMQDEWLTTTSQTSAVTTCQDGWRCKTSDERGASRTDVPEVV